MKQACDKVAGGTFKILTFEERATPEGHLRALAQRFSEAYEKREDADYDVGKRWSPEEAKKQIQNVEDAFSSWRAIRDQPEAQKFLVLLLGPRQRKRPA